MAGITNFERNIRATIKALIEVDGEDPKVASTVTRKMAARIANLNDLERRAVLRLCDEALFRAKKRT